MHTEFWYAKLNEDLDAYGENSIETDLKEI
jgi:hypothetical protein